MPIHVSILIPKGHTSLMNIVGTHQFFSQVNSFLQEREKPTLFRIELVGIARPTDQTNGLFSVHPEKLIHDVSASDLIIIPAIHDSPEVALQQNWDFIPWLKAQHKKGAEIASLCVAAFFQAGTGILDGK